jgi:hypothetical protein
MRDDPAAVNAPEYVHYRREIVERLDDGTFVLGEREKIEPDWD